MSERPVIDIEDGSEFDEALVISCFPSEGFVSSIVAHFLVDKLGLELVGGIRHSGLPPVCLVQEGSPFLPLGSTAESLFVTWISAIRWY